MSILSEAANIVDGDRQQTYGTPAENHGRTAALWSAYLGFNITARQVCIMNILQKCSRDRFKPHRDNLVDVAGYAECAQRCETPDPAGTLIERTYEAARMTATEVRDRAHRCPSSMRARDSDAIAGQPGGEIVLQCTADAGHEGSHTANEFRWD